MRFDQLTRREFTALLGGAATWPFAARAQQQQRERMRRIGVTTTLSSEDPEGQDRNAAFLQGLQELGWVVGRNVRIEYRWGGADFERNRRNTTELVSLAPDVILATGSVTLDPVLQATRTIPIVFVQVADPVGSGAVENLAHPGGNATGFTAMVDYGSSGKWLELLKEIAPQTKRVAVLRDSRTAAGFGQLGAIAAVAPAFGVQLRPISLADGGEIKRAIAAFAREPDGGLIITESGPSIVHRAAIIALAEQYRLPAVYGQRLFVTSGGLISYGHNTIEPYRRAAGYVDRILKGEKPADLPVQAPTAFELVLNLRTAKALGLDLPASVLARADEVIE
jgi:putative ABC transport system substrate-binding protein